MEMGWDITKFYYWAYVQGAKNTFCEKKSANEPKHSETIRFSQFTTDPTLPTLPYVLAY